MASSAQCSGGIGPGAGARGAATARRENRWPGNSGRNRPLESGRVRRGDESIEATAIREGGKKRSRRPGNHPCRRRVRAGEPTEIRASTLTTGGNPQQRIDSRRQVSTRRAATANPGDGSAGRRHSLDLQVSVPSGRTAEAIKADVVALANAILAKLP
jgi:hypothetical protein